MSCLAELLHTAVQVAYLGPHGHDHLAVQIELGPEHPVGGGMLRAHAYGQQVAAAAQPLAAGGLALFELLEGGGQRRGGGAPRAGLRARCGAHILPRRLGAYPTAHSALHGEVLAQRKALEVIGGKQAAQVRMPLELYAEHLPGLALVEAGRRPERGHRAQLLSFGESGAHPQAMAVSHRDQVRDHLQGRRRPLRQVVAQERVQSVAGQLGHLPAGAQHLGPIARGHHVGEFAAPLDALQQPLAKALLKRLGTRGQAGG